MNNPFDPGYYTESDLQEAGFRSLGHDVRIARNCIMTGLDQIEIGSHVRIDGLTSILVQDGGWLRIGSYVHISGGCLISARAGIQFEDFSGISQGVRIFSEAGPADDSPAGVVLKESGRRCESGVSLGRHAIVGTGCVILPHASIDEGVSVGANSLVERSLEAWGVYFGSPAVRLKTRSRQLLELEARLAIDRISG